ncbi:MAG: carotenoid biosynthesis protein, partial [Bacteroidota bacterium]
LNWVILVWAAYSVWPSTAHAWLAALGVVFMDVILEPGATALGFWTWQHRPVLGQPWSTLLVAPLRNYAAWGILAWVMIRILGRKSSGVPVVMPSRTAIFYTTCMLLYFGILLLGKFMGAFQ